MSLTYQELEEIAKAARSSVPDEPMASPTSALDDDELAQIAEQARLSVPQETSAPMQFLRRAGVGALNALKSTGESVIKGADYVGENLIAKPLAGDDGAGYVPWQTPEALQQQAPPPDNLPHAAQVGADIAGGIAGSLPAFMAGGELTAPLKALPVIGKLAHSVGTFVAGGAILDEHGRTQEGALTNAAMGMVPPVVGKVFKRAPAGIATNLAERAAVGVGMAGVGAGAQKLQGQEVDPVETTIFAGIGGIMHTPERTLWKKNGDGIQPDTTLDADETAVLGADGEASEPPPVTNAPAAPEQSNYQPSFAFKPGEYKPMDKSAISTRAAELSDNYDGDIDSFLASLDSEHPKVRRAAKENWGDLLPGQTVKVENEADFVRALRDVAGYDDDEVMAALTTWDRAAQSNGMTLDDLIKQRLGKVQGHTSVAAFEESLKPEEATLQQPLKQTAKVQEEPPDPLGEFDENDLPPEPDETDYDTGPAEPTYAENPKYWEDKMAKAADQHNKAMEWHKQGMYADAEMADATKNLADTYLNYKAAREKDITPEGQAWIDKQNSKVYGPDPDPTEGMFPDDFLHGKTAYDQMAEESDYANGYGENEHGITHEEMDAAVDDTPGEEYFKSLIDEHSKAAEEHMKAMSSEHIDGKEAAENLGKALGGQLSIPPGEGAITALGFMQEATPKTAEGRAWINKAKQIVSDWEDAYMTHQSFLDQKESNKTPKKKYAPQMLFGDEKVKGPMGEADIAKWGEGPKLAGLGEKKVMLDLGNQKVPIKIAPHPSSRNFWNWFRGSKIVDEKGHPLVAFHGTHAKEEFDVFGNPELGYHFGNLSQAQARGGTGRILPVYLSMKKPLYLPDGFDPGNWSAGHWLRAMYNRGGMNAKTYSSLISKMAKFKEGGEWYHLAEKQKKSMRSLAIKQALMKMGYDGIIHENRFEGPGHSYIVFDPRQIKSAIGNNGEFSPKNPSILKQKPAGAGEVIKGAVSFDEAGKATLHLFENADISTFLHESAHIFRKMLAKPEDVATVEKWAGVEGGKWTVDAEEKFARGFERYMRSGKAPVPELESVFAKIKEWLTGIYKKLKGSDIDVNISKEMRDVFDRLFIKDGWLDKEPAKPAEGGTQPLYQRQKQLSKEEEAIHSVIHYGGQPERVRKLMGQGFTGMMNRWKERLFNENLPIDIVTERANKQLAREGKPTLSPRNNPSVNKRTIYGAFGTSEEAVAGRGLLDYYSGEPSTFKKDVKDSTGKVVFKAGDKIPSFEEVLRMVPAGEDNKFRAYAMSRAAVEAWDQHKMDIGVPLKEARAVKAKYAGTAHDKAFNAMMGWKQSVMDYAVKSGVITRASADAMGEAWKEHIPLRRLMEADELLDELVDFSKNKGVAGVREVYKKRHGSTRKVLDPIKVIMDNAHAVLDAAERNHFMNSLTNLSGIKGMDEYMMRIPRVLAKNRPNAVRMGRAGKAEYWEFDPDLRRSVLGMSSVSRGVFSRLFSVPANILRAGQVLHPAFTIANIFRDSINSAIISETGAGGGAIRIPFGALVRAFNALIIPSKRRAWTEAGHELRQAGGDQALENSYLYDQDRAANITKASLGLKPGEKLMNLTRRGWKSEANPVEQLQRFAKWGETITRRHEFMLERDQKLKAGLPRRDAIASGAFKSRQLLDFAQSGRWTKGAKGPAAFFGSQLQGLYREFGALMGSGSLTPAERTAKIAKVWMKGTLYLTVPTVINFLKNQDDPEYLNASQVRRDAFWFVRLPESWGGGAVWVPKPPGIIGYGFTVPVERSLMAFKKEDPQAFKNWGSGLLGQLPNPTPTAARWPFEAIANYSVYQGRPIIPEYMKERPAEEQYTADTSLTSRAIAGGVKKIKDATGVKGALPDIAGHVDSPIMLDYLRDSIFGSLGKAFTKGVNLGRDEFHVILSAAGHPDKEIPGIDFPGLDKLAEGVRKEDEPVRQENSLFSRFQVDPARYGDEVLNRFYEKRNYLNSEKNRESLGEEAEVDYSELKGMDRTAKRITKLRNEMELSADEYERAELRREIISLASQWVELAKGADNEPRPITRLKRVAGAAGNVPSTQQ